MAKLIIRNSRTGQEFDANDLDFNTVTPQQIIDNMRGNIPDPPQGWIWYMLKGGDLVDKSQLLYKLGFKDGDTAVLIALVEGA